MTLLILKRGALSKESPSGHGDGKNLDEGAQNLQSVSGGGDAVSLPVSPDEGDLWRR